MKQYFYLVGHCVVGDDFVMDKVFLQERDAVRWGKTFASKHEEYTVSLFKQEITRTGTIQFEKFLEGWKNEPVQELTDEEKSEARKRMFREAGVLKD